MSMDQDVLSLEEKLLQLEKIRKDFVANISHELRTPLTVFKGYLETLSSHGEFKDPQLAKIIRQMQSHSQRMKNIIHDLLLLSRLEAIEDLPVNQQTLCVYSILEQLQQDALQSHQTLMIELMGDRELTLQGDEDDLKSLFSNLLFNAVRYTPEGGSVTMRWFLDGKDRVFVIQDTGIGIAPEHIDRVTERFYRVDKARSRDKRWYGAGVGDSQASVDAL